MGYEKIEITGKIQFCETTMIQICENSWFTTFRQMWFTFERVLWLRSLIKTSRNQLRYFQLLHWGPYWAVNVSIVPTLPSTQHVEVIYMIWYDIYDIWFYIFWALYHQLAPAGWRINQFSLVVSSFIEHLSHWHWFGLQTILAMCGNQIILCTKFAPNYVLQSKFHSILLRLVWVPMFG